MVISLTENADVPELVGPVHPNEYTQRDEDACITRMLIVDKINNYSFRRFNSPNDYNTLSELPIVPSLNSIMEDKMKSYL